LIFSQRSQNQETESSNLYPALSHAAGTQKAEAAKTWKKAEPEGIINK
jgi:hypothetical protein